jgi:hypothetical protein
LKRNLRAVVKPKEKEVRKNGRRVDYVKVNATEEEKRFFKGGEGKGKVFPVQAVEALRVVRG